LLTLSRTQKRFMDEILSTLEKILEQRKSATADNSYVASLYNQGTDKILDKISEESAEVIKAAKDEGNDKIIYEMADLWFHTLVLLRHKNISIKEYENLEGVKTLDFIFVFIPIEGALLCAYNYKQSLHSYALKKNVLLVSPSSLSMSLKLVNFMWQTANQNKNSEEIARQAGAMYDKLALFVEELDRVEGHLDKAKDGYSEARKKLSTGKGNLISRAEKIKTLGVAPKKELSE